MASIRRVSRWVPRSVRIAAALVALWTASPLLAQTTLTVAAAADLGPALREIAGQFDQRSGSKTALVFGSSGNLTTQIEHGAPFDAFLSADLDYPHRLEGEGLAVLGSLTTYAFGKLALWAPKNSPLALGALEMKALTRPEVRAIAIANPEHAPYGKAAVAALRTANLYDKLKSKLVFGENVAQAAQFVVSGNAQVGIVPLSLALAPELARNGQWWALPPKLYPRIAQGGVVLRKSSKQELAQIFLAFLKSKEAGSILQRYGFDLTETQR